MDDTDAVMEIIKETFPQPGSGEGKVDVTKSFIFYS